MPRWAELAPVIGAGWERLRRSSRRSRTAAAAAVMLLALGVVLTLMGPRSSLIVPPIPPRPGQAAAGSATAGSGHLGKGQAPARQFRCTTGAQPGMGGISPVHLCIPSIEVNSDLVQLGLNADQTVQVPPLSEVGIPGWYKYSPAPGSPGPAVILGHVDSAQYGKGVFFDLGRLHSRDTISITRADGRLAVYRVDRVAEFPKSNFPTQAVYGNTAKSTLRLITCGGAFDSSTGSYDDNIIAFATLASLTKI